MLKILAAKMSDRVLVDDFTEEVPIRGIKLNHSGRKFFLGRPKAPASGVFASHLQAIQAVQQQHVAEQLLRSQTLSQQLQQQQLGPIKKVHPLQRQFLRSRSAFIRPVR